jgi:hypothetical protein
MLRLECVASVLLPEHPEAQVFEPQFAMFWLPGGQALVDVYFMLGLGLEIFQPHAVPVGPDISLRYVAHSLSGAVAASRTLRRIVYRFADLSPRRHAFSLRALTPGQFRGRDPGGPP